MDRPFQSMAMPDHAVAAVGELPILHGGEESLGLHLDRLCMELPRPGPQQDARQGIIDIIGLAKADDGAILFRGVSELCGNLGDEAIRRRSGTARS